MAKAEEKIWLHRIINYLWYKETDRPIMIVYDITRKHEGLSQATDTEWAQIYLISQSVV